MLSSCNSKGQYMKTAILAVFLFLVMIFPHELGHFIAARKCGVQVNEFSFGMGPAIWKKQKGETLYAIRLFPIGGYCAMEGEDGQNEDEEEGTGTEIEVKDPDDPRSFNNKKPWQKIIILAAGSAMNVFCAFLILTLLATYIGFTTNVIDMVVEDSPAYTAGIEAGDEIVSIDDESVSQWDQVVQAVQGSSGNEMTVGVIRNGEQVEVLLTPEFNEERNTYVIGAQCRVSHNPVKAVGYGARGTVRMFGIMIDSLKMILSGGASLEDISGPVGMVQMVGETSSQGLWSYGFLVALICVNLAVINMLPLPALDGGRILLIIINKITGNKITPKMEGMINAVGMMILLVLMVLLIFKDAIGLMR